MKEHRDKTTIKQIATPLILTFLVLTFRSGVWAQSPAHLEVYLLPSILVHAPASSEQLILFTDRLANTNEWHVLTNVVLESTNIWVTDYSATHTSMRFYRSVTLRDGMALVPAGTFTMGKEFEPGDDADEEPESPAHTVELSSYWIDRTEITRAHWDQVYQWAITNGYMFDSSGQGKAPNHPVGAVRWFDAIKWCNARSEREGVMPAYYTDGSFSVIYRTYNRVEPSVNWSSGYRLPTEAEWERAARGEATGTRFPWGDSITHSNANYYSSWINGAPRLPYDHSATEGLHPDYDDGVFPQTSPAGAFAPNSFGLYDMVGNVQEWCWDWWKRDYYSTSPLSNPRGPGSGDTRVKRGGCFPFPYSAWYARISARDRAWPDSDDDEEGFRCVLPVGH